MNKLKLAFLTNLPQLKRVINYGLYLIFTFYIGYLIRSSNSIGSKLFFLLVGAAVLSTLLLFDYLKTIYKKMISSLTVDCDDQQAIFYKKKLQKHDIFHGFKQSLILFDGLLLLDQGRFQECLAHLNAHHSFYHSTLDYLLIAKRTELQCAYFLQDQPLFDCAYHELKKIKNQATKKHPVSPLYSWDEINGLNFFCQRRNGQAQKSFAMISTERFNPREEAYLFFEQAQVEFALGHQSAAHQLLKEVKSRSNTLYLTELAERKKRITFEKY